MDLTFFNPHSQTEADFLASFVARGELLQYFLRQLRLLSAREPARHHLIVAPRGYGKTSLLRRIAIAVRTEADLAAKLIPLTFREEQHNVISMDVFWRNCLQSLAEAREDEHAPEVEVEALDAEWGALAPRQALSREAQDGNPAWIAFKRHCVRLGRRPLLLIDNFDSLLAGLPSIHQWALRGVLQQEDGPMLIAAAPRFPESTQDRAAAFYDFFANESLDKLSDQEVMRCLHTTALRRGETGRAVLELLEKNHGRIAALNALAGGNPRTLSVLYRVLESHMSADVLSQLSAMLDTFTSWYQSRAEDLPVHARAVFDALALNWDPMTAAQVSAVTGLDTTAASSQISRLEKAALVEAVALNRQGKGRSGYQLTERFFNIWYLMRNGPRRARQSIKFLAVFLQSCFSVAERRILAQTAIRDGRVQAGYAIGLAASFRTGFLREQLLDYAGEESTRSGANEEYAAAIDELRKEGRSEGARGSGRLRKSEKRRPKGGSKLEARIYAADALYVSGKMDEAIAMWDSVVADLGDYSDASLRRAIAGALLSKGIALGQLDKFEQAIETCDSVVARFGDDLNHEMRAAVGAALVNKGVALDALGKYVEAIEAYDHVAVRFGDDADSVIRAAVGAALVNKGFALGRLGRHEEAIEVYDRVVMRFGEDRNPALRAEVARALGNKGFRLGRIGQHEQAVKAYDGVVQRFGDDSEPAVRREVGRSLFNKAVDLGALGQPERAVEIYNCVAEWFRDDHDPVMRTKAAQALFNKGVTLGQLRQSEQAIAVYDNVVERFGDDADPTLREAVARSLLSKGDLLIAAGAFHDAEEAFRKAAATGANEIQGRVATRIGNLFLDRIGDPDGALLAYSSGLAGDVAPESRPILHANAAYALALHRAAFDVARGHVDLALSDGKSVSVAGRHLLSALMCLAESKTTRWSSVFAQIGLAVGSDDPLLWSNYLDDLQRLIAYVVSQGEGPSLRTWMEQSQYPLQYAPLYQAVVAALEGQDALLRINPETRTAAEGIYEGIARRLKLYPMKRVAGSLGTKKRRR